MIPMIDRDTNAFNAYMDAMAMPKKTEEEIAARDAAMGRAVSVPLEGMRTAFKAWPFMIEMAKIGNIKSMSDLQVGAKCLETGIWGCFQNVLINVDQITDAEYVKATVSEAEEMAEKSKEHLAEVLAILKGRKDAGEK